MGRACGSKWAVRDLNQVSQGAEDKELTKMTDGEGVHNPVHNSEISPQIERIIRAWPGLSEGQKQRILNIIDEAGLAR